MKCSTGGAAQGSHSPFPFALCPVLCALCPLPFALSLVPRSQLPRSLALTVLWYWNIEIWDLLPSSSIPARLPFHALVGRPVLPCHSGLASGYW
jgi:hypothetical protein